jgi:hypothetical protein
MQKVKSVMILILLSMLIVSSAFVLPAKAFPADKPAIVVEPANLLNPSLVPGSTFLINVSLYNATVSNVPNGIAGVEIRLSWNNSVIQPLSFVNKITASDGVMAGASVLYGISPGFFDNSNIRINSPPYTNATNYKVAAGSTTGPWWGNGIIVTINFTVVAVGRSGLDLTFTDLTDTLANEVDHYVQNGVFDNRVPPPPPPPVVILVDPPSIINSLLTPPSSFRINLSIVNAVNLASFGFGLSFNSSILQATSSTWSWNGSALGLQINNGAGVINGSTNISPPITGNVPLVTMNFNVTGLGESIFHIFGLSLFDVNGFQVPINVTHDGYFNNMLITSIYVDPAFRMDPSLHPGNTTMFSIVAQNFVNVRTCQFDLRFNPNVLKVLSYMVTNPIGPSFVNFQLLSFNNTLGDLSGILTYDPVLSVPSSPIINITFIIVGYGVSPLNLNSTALTDANGNLISHQTADGLFITAIRDVAITNVEPYPQKVYPGRIVTVNVTAANLGNLTETFTVSAYVDTTVSLGTQSVTALAPGANITLSFSWNTTGQPSCTSHALSANASFVPFEFNTTNNFMVGLIPVKIKILGDINGDGKVDLLDLVLLANAYGSKAGDLKYNPEADFNDDGKVNLLDLVTCAMHYGQSCP